MLIVLMVKSFFVKFFIDVLKKIIFTNTIKKINYSVDAKK